MSAAELYEASPVNRRHRATKAEMEERAQFLIDYAEAHGPVTVRGLYYRAEVESLPGIDKTEDGYTKIQRQVPPEQLKILQAAEASERELIRGLVGGITGDGEP